MAAARASLLEVLTPEAYAHLAELNDRIVAGCQRSSTSTPARLHASASGRRAA